MSFSTSTSNATSTSTSNSISTSNLNFNLNQKKPGINAGLIYLKPKNGLIYFDVAALENEDFFDLPASLVFKSPVKSVRIGVATKIEE